MIIKIIHGLPPETAKNGPSLFMELDILMQKADLI
jgi:hypothetical protein